MRRSVVATAYGGPEVLSLIEDDVPDPGPGEVRLAVRAAGVNPVDYKAYSGAWGTDPANLPMRLGAEAAGVVTAIASGITGVAVGDEVLAYRASGAYTTDLVVPVESVVPKPASLPWTEAGGLLLTGATAVHALTAVHVAAGDTVLVHGASGGVGLMAVQLAVSSGATVIGTAREANHELLRDLGVVPVRYGPGLAGRVQAAAPGGVDAALDLVGTDEAVEVSLALVRDPDRIVSIAAFGRGVRAIGGGPDADPGDEIRASARFQLTDAVAAGRLRVILAGSYPLAQVADAHRELARGHTTGKLVLIP